MTHLYGFKILLLGGYCQRNGAVMRYIRPLGPVQTFPEEQGREDVYS